MFRSFMYGRYGIHLLSKVLFVIVALLLVWIALMPRHLSYTFQLSWAVAFMVYASFRCLSRNVARRSQEEAAFGQLVIRLKQWWWRVRRQLHIKPRDQRDKTMKILACPKCGQKLRVPRGKGVIRITCSRCQEKFEKRT